MAASPSFKSHSIALPLGALAVAMISVQIGAALVKGLFPAAGVAGATALRLGFASLMLVAVWRPWRLRPTAREVRSILDLRARDGMHEFLLLFVVEPHSARHRGRPGVHRTSGSRHGGFASRGRFSVDGAGGARARSRCCLWVIGSDLGRIGVVFALGCRAFAGRSILSSARKRVPRTAGHHGDRHDRGRRRHRAHRGGAGRRAAARRRRFCRRPAASPLLSSAVPYSLEMFALTRIADANVRRADERGAGARRAVGPVLSWASA